MDFSLTDDQQELQGLARRILDDRVTHDHLKEVEAGDGLDTSTWDELAKAGFVGIACSSDVGGGGLGFLEVAVVLEEIGRHVAPVPYLSSVVTGMLAVDRFGNDDQRREVLPDAIAGTALLSGALSEEANPDRGRPATTATPPARGHGAWTLTGAKHFVPWASSARLLLVPATTDDGTAVFLVECGATGLSRNDHRTTDRQQVSTVTLDHTPGMPLGSAEERSAVLPWMLDLASAALCVVQAGVCERALRMTADYTIGREQFDHPIASFQAVSQRAGDAYIDTLAVQLTAWQAAWRLAEGLPATDEIRIAKFWAADGASRVLHAASHLHGGIGVDVDYPLHRYFNWARWIELSLGSGSEQLVALGASMAAEA
ncbi:MAG: acyl-CoA/acyl-ACP dehydrogenase [Acidimicrobiia bacterium]|nr:acyl-CoA/acyl-ACP dehydrogenase [Acidimicrobiia bacterium]